MNIKKFCTEEKNIYHFSALLVYLITGIYFLKYYQYQINPDCISYILTAEKYLSGNLWNAVSSHWSPLISWLLMPFIVLQIKPLLAFKILNLIIGFFTITGIIILTYRFDLEEYLRITAAFTSVMPVLWWVFVWSTPDLLVVMTLVYYFIFIFDKNYGRKKYNGIICGISGSLAYLAKSYHFPFFLFHFSLANLIHYIYNKKLSGKIFKNFIWGLSVFILISLPWITVMSTKYKTITFSSAGKYNYYVFLADLGQPMHREGFMEPFPGEDLSVWEDPALFDFKIQEGRKVNFIQGKIIEKNLKELIKICNNYSYLFIIITITFIIILCKKEVFQDSSAVILILTFLIYPAGYTLLFLEDRYIWLCGILLIFMGIYILNFLMKNKNTNQIFAAIILIIFMISFWYYPAKELKKNKNKGKCFYTWSETIKNKYDINGNIASDKDYWWQTLYICYHLRAKHYGEACHKNVTFKSLQRDFEKYDIDYYFQWDKSNKNIIYYLSKNYKEIKDPSLPFYIYKIKD